MDQELEGQLQKQVDSYLNNDAILDSFYDHIGERVVEQMKCSGQIDPFRIDDIAGNIKSYLQDGVPFSVTRSLEVRIDNRCHTALVKVWSVAEDNYGSVVGVRFRGSFAPCGAVITVNLLREDDSFRYLVPDEYINAKIGWAIYRFRVFLARTPREVQPKADKEESSVRTKVEECPAGPTLGRDYGKVAWSALFDEQPGGSVMERLSDIGERVERLEAEIFGPKQAKSREQIVEQVTAKMKRAGLTKETLEKLARMM